MNRSGRLYYYRRVSSIFAQVLAANCANDANGPHAINAVGNDRNSLRPIRVIRAIRGSDFGCGYAALYNFVVSMVVFFSLAVIPLRAQTVTVTGTVSLVRGSSAGTGKF